MKRLFTLCLGIITVLAVKAQSDFPLQFADKDGNTIADKTVLNLSEIIANDFGDIQVPTHLYVKNTTDADVQAGAVYTIRSISGGAFQTCFPSNCIQKRETGQYETGNDVLKAGTLKDMETEWLPVGDGSCVVVYQLVTYKQNVITKKWNIDKEGPTITLNFSHRISAVESLGSDKAIGRIQYFDLQGKAISAPRKGMYIRQITLSDGTRLLHKVVQR